MKRSVYLLSIVTLAAFVLGLGGCNLLTSLSTPVPSGTGEGSVTIQLQAVSQTMQAVIQSWVKSKQPFSSKSIAPKAYVAAQKVMFELRDSTGIALLDGWTDFPPASNPGYPVTVGTRSYAPGTYQLRAYVYNDPADTNAAVSGSTTFTIAAGDAAADHTVLVTCYPVSPDALTVGSSSSSFSLDKPWIVNFSNGQISQIGSERWFTVVAETGLTNFILTPDPGSAAVTPILLFGPDGAGLRQQMPSMPGVGVSIGAVPTTVGATYYIAVADFSDPAAPIRSVKLSVQNCTIYTDADVAITPSASYQVYSIDPYHVQWYTFNAVAGNIYTVNWDDWGLGSGLYTADVSVTAYRADRTTIVQTDGGMPFSNQGEGYVGSSYYSNGNYWTYSVDMTKTFTATATETVYLKVEQPNPGTTTTNYALKVEDMGTNHPPRATAWTNNSNIGVGSPATVNSNAWDDDSGQVLSYSWVILSGPDSNGLSNVDQPQAIFTPDQPGTYQIQVTVTDNGTPSHSVSSSCWVTAVYNAPPVVDYAYPSTWTVTLTGAPIVYLYASGYDPDGQAVTYEWSFGSRPADSYVQINNYNQPNASLIPDAAGTYDITCTVKDILGGVASMTFTITVYSDGTSGGIGVGIN